MDDATTFGELAIGDSFVFSRYARSGLLADLERPGDVLHEKISARKWRRLDNLTEGRIGRSSARVWPRPDTWENLP